jgi:hypothetical protein
MVIEAPFRGMEGPLHEQFEKFQEISDKGIDLAKMSREKQRSMPFYCKQFNFEYGIRCGAFTPEFIEGEKVRLGPLFGMYYGAEPYQSDQSWFTPDMFQYSDEANKFFDGI